MRKQLWTRLTAAALAALLTAALPTGISAAAQEDTAPPVEETPLTEILPAEPQSPQETPDEPDTPSAEEPTPVPQEIPLTEILPAESLAQATAENAAGAEVPYLDEDGAPQSVPSATLVTESDTAWDDGWYVAQDSITIHSRVTVSGDVRLILADGCELTIDGGIQVAHPNSLTIYGQSEGSGRLTATAPAESNIYHAAIGGSTNVQIWEVNYCGSVTINGGDVTATGGDASSGIGGGPVSGGKIVINGGTVTATGGNNAAGIGGGMQGNGGSVTINGGEVTATGGNQAAGIGSGTMGGRIQIQINGGTVNATGGSQGAGIGDGMECSNDGSITITGGTVTATGGYQGTGIGGGAKTPGGKITISGGTVTANGADGASGIGHGGLGATGGEITISGGTVTATGGSGNPGISCQDAPENDSPIGEAGWILISGGTVYASPKAGEENGSAIRGSFKTGIDGDAFVVANGTGITDETNQDAWSGVIFDGDGDGKVYGNPTLETDAKIPAGKKLTIPQGSSLTISRGKKLELTDSTLTVESGAMLTNNGTISGNSNSKVESNGSLGGSGTVEGDITVPDPKDSAVSISPSSAAYGSEVTLTAQISRAPAANARADQGKVDFYLGTQDSGTKLGTADVINNTAELTITLSEEKGFKIGENTITADFGGSMVLGSKIVSAQLTVTGNLNDAVVTVSGNHVYTGSPITPAVSVTWNNTPLTKDTDYTLAYTDNTNAGTATVTVTGTGNYTGTKTESFTIGKAKQAALSITGKPSTPIIYGQEFTLSADGGSGRGAVTWAVTSNPAYATVDNTGKVQITGVGAVAITATKAEDANYKETAATYDFTTQKAIPLVGTVSKTSPETIYPTTALADIRILYGSHIFHKTAPKHEAVPSMVRIPNNQQTLES